MLNEVIPFEKRQIDRLNFVQLSIFFADKTCRDQENFGD